jgi:hypothetical protein
MENFFLPPNGLSFFGMEGGLLKWVKNVCKMSHGRGLNKFTKFCASIFEIFSIGNLSSDCLGYSLNQKYEAGDIILQIKKANYI